MFKLSKSKHPNLAKVYKEAKEIYDEMPVVKSRRRRRSLVLLFKVVAYVVLVLALILMMVLGTQLFTARSVFGQIIEGKNNLQAALDSVKTQDFRSAVMSSTLAEENFRLAAGGLNELKTNRFVVRLPKAKSQIESIEYLAKSGEMIARAATGGAEFGQELKALVDPDKQLAYSKLAPEEKKRILGKIYESAPELTGIKANVDLALYNVSRVNYAGVLWLFQGKILELRNQLTLGSNFLKEAIPLSQIMPALAGYPERAVFLVMLENSDELRPTGGFLGTYGILEIESGDIIRFETHDIYHMDMPVKDQVNVEPPEPIKKYLNPKWYMRDANWSPDWPTAAKQLEWFYALENKQLPPKDQINRFDGQFTGVLAITPKFVTDLLALVGPIRLGEEIYSEGNFVDLLEYKVEKGYVALGIPSWHRKEVIGDILKELKIRVLDLPSSNWQQVSKILLANLSAKNILLHHQAPLIQSLIEEQGWGGELYAGTDDYLMVVDANMASLKTDAVISRGLDYQVTERPQGLFATLTVHYAHQGKRDWKTSDYKTYTRVYVPTGTQLVNASGSLRSEVTAGEEKGKTYFGALLNIPVGETGSLIFEYKLPDRLKARLSDGNYHLFVQRQPGTNVEELTVDVNLLSSIQSYGPVGFSANPQNNHQISWETDLINDKIFSLNLKTANR